MKAKLVLTPLAMAMAAVLSVAAYADQGGEGKGKDDHHHQQHHQQPSIPDWLKGGATATVTDAQYNHGNQVTNKGTQNNASANGSIGGVSGNVGANVAAGDNNQQANAVALATADESFVFGYANASTSVTQQAYNNKLDNYSTANNASLNNSLQGISGNFGVNVARATITNRKTTWRLPFPTASTPVQLAAQRKPAMATSPPTTPLSRPSTYRSAWASSQAAATRGSPTSTAIPTWIPGRAKPTRVVPIRATSTWIARLKGLQTA